MIHTFFSVVNFFHQQHSRTYSSSPKSILAVILFLLSLGIFSLMRMLNVQLVIIIKCPMKYSNFEKDWKMMSWNNLFLCVPGRKLYATDDYLVVCITILHQGHNVTAKPHCAYLVNNLPQELLSKPFVK